MTIRSHSSQHRILNRALALSGLAHLCAALFFLVGPVLFVHAPRMVPPSLRVDLVGLPTQKSTQAPPPVTAPVPVPPPPVNTSAPPLEKGEMALRKPRKKENKKEKDAKKKLKQALERIRAIERIKALTAGEPVRGNRISRGTSLSAEARTALEAGYFEVVLERVRSQWELPKWLLGQGLSAQVLLHLDARGNIRSFRFIRPSGNPGFDEEVKRALNAANPFPIPPEDIAGGVLDQGILLGFPL
jgi:protein TonB